MREKRKIRVCMLFVRGYDEYLAHIIIYYYLLLL